MAEPTTRQTLSVVIPVYWNEDSIPFLGEKLAEFELSLQALDLALEVIFIDDGSGDNSLMRLLELRDSRPGVKVLSLSRNFGATAASKTGFRFVTGDCFVTVAADLQDPLEQVFEMAKHWRAGHRLVISRRESRDDPFLTKFFASLYYRLIRLLVVKDYPIGGFDLMLADRVLLPYLAGSGKHTNPTLYAFWLGFQPVILSYHRRAREHGTSRWTFGKKLNFMIDSISGFSVVPIRLISGFGMIVALLSFIYGLNLVIYAALGHATVQGFYTLATLIAFFSGLILVMLGVVGEYVWRIFDNVNAKPESVIANTWIEADDK
jgi:polyisoprenyl-phosphate glycosyltransferase